MAKHDKRMNNVERTTGRKHARVIVEHTYAPGVVPKWVRFHEAPAVKIGEHDRVITVAHTFWSPLSSFPYDDLRTPEQKAAGIFPEDDD